MHCWPIVHSAEVTQICAEPMVDDAVAGRHDPPAATTWHLVFACVVFATPQHTEPAAQSIWPRQANPAWKEVHELLCGMHEPFGSMSTQHVLVLRLQSCALGWIPHFCGPPA